MNTSNPMTQGRLDAVQARTDAAQNTPWQRGEDDEPMPSTDDYTSTVNDHDGDPVGYCPDCGVRSYYSAQTADLIAHAPQDLTDLLAEVERLRARLTVDGGMAERAARAFYEYPTPGVDASLRTGWDRLTKASPDVADKYRRSMTAALDAVLGTGEEA